MGSNTLNAVEGEVKCAKEPRVQEDINDSTDHIGPEHT